MDDRMFTFTELEQIIRDRMYTMESGRQPREGCNAKFYDLIYYLKYGEDDPDGAFAHLIPENN